MSGSIEERIVRMVFDNAKFESGIKESSNSLASFEERLDHFFRGNHSSGELENAVTDIADAADTAGDHFDLLDAAGTAALLSLAKTAANVASEIASNLANFTINFEMENAKIGMSKYEQQVEATQKIVNTVRSTTNGAMESVESAMERVTPVVQTLQKYADETSYKMSDMTTALGMFTGAGIELKTAEKAIMGVANWAAISGVNANNAGRAFQNISQAMSKNALLYEDMKTFQWMGMGTPEFKKTVIEAAKELGTIREAGEGVYEVIDPEEDASSSRKKAKKAATFTVDTFESELSKRWANRAVLEKVFGEMYGSGFWDEAGKQIYDNSLASRAFAAGQEAKTWTDAWEAMRETATSNWSQTWEYIYGNYAEAVKLWTPVANAMINVVDIVGTVRNAFAEIFHDRGGQQWLVDMASKLEEVTSGWVDFADEVLVALGLVEESSDETAESVTTTAGELTGDLAKMSEMAKKNAEQVRGYIDTGSVKMKPGTKQTFNELADAWQDLDTYLNSGSVDADVLAQKLDNINKLTDQASKTNKLLSFKKKGLLGMLKELGELEYNDDDISKANKKIGTADATTAKAAGEATGELTKAQRLAERLRPIMENVKSGQGLINAAVQAGKDNLPKFSTLLSIMGDRYLTMAENISKFIPRLSNFIQENNILSTGLSFTLDKLIMFAGGIAKVKSVFAIFRRAVINGIFDFLESDAFTKFKNDHLMPIFQITQMILDLVGSIMNLGINEFLANVNSLADTLRKTVSGFLTDLVSGEGVSNVFNTIYSYLQDVGKWLTELREEILQRGFLTTIVSRVAAGIAKLSVYLGKFKDYVMHGILAFLKDPFKTISDFWTNVQQTVEEKVSSIFSPKGLLVGGASLIDGVFGSLDKTLDGLRTKYKDDAEVLPFINGLDKNLVHAREAIAQFKTSLESGEIGTKFIGAMASFYNRIELIKQGLKSFIDDPKSGLIKVGNVIKDKFASAFSENGLASKGLGFFRDQLAKAQTYFDGLKEKLSDNPTALKVITWLEDKVGRIRTRFEELKAAIDSGGFISAITSKFEAFKGQLDRLGIDEKLRYVKAWFDDLNLSEKLESMKNAISGFVTSFMSDPTAALASVKEQLISGFWSVIDGVKAFLAENFTLDKLLPDMSNAGPDISKKIFDVLGFTGGSIKSPFSGLNALMSSQVKGWTWIENMLLGGPKEERDAQKSISDKIGDVIQKLFGIQSAAADEYEFGENPFASQEKKGNFFDSLSSFIASSADSLGKVFDKAQPVFSAISSGNTFSSIKSIVSDVAVMTGKKKEGTALKNFADILKNLAIAVGAFVAGAVVLSLVPMDKLAGNLAVLGAFIAALAGVSFLTKKLKLDNIGTMLEKVGQGLFAMAASILVMIVNITLLSNMSWETFISGMLKATIILGLMIGAILGFAQLFKTSDMAKGKMLGETVGQLASAIAVMTASLAVLGVLPMKTVVQGLVAIGLMLAGIVASIVAIGRFSKDPKAIEASAKAISSIGNAIKVMTASLVILGNMSPERLIQGMLAMAGMLISVIVTMKVAEKLSKGLSFSSLFAFAIAFGGIAIAFGSAMALVKGMDWQSIAAFSAGLSVSVIALAAAMKIISTIPMAGAVQGGAGVAIIVGIIAGIVAIAGAINELTKGRALDLMKSGGEMLETIGKSFGKFFGGLAAGVMDAASSGLTSVASNLSSFSSIAGPFFSMISGLDTSKLADFSSFLGDVITVGAREGVTDAARNIGDIGGALTSFSSATKDLVANGVVRNSKAAKAISEHIRDIVKNLSGDDGSKIGNTRNTSIWLARIGAAIGLYGKSISEIPEMDAQQTLNKADQVAKFVNYIINNIDGSELQGSIDEFPDSSSLTVFGLDLIALAGAITKFSEAAKNIKPEETKNGTDLLDYFADLQERLTPVGGVMAWFKGKREDLGEFATDINQLTGAMGSFVTEANKIKDDEKLETAKGLLDYFANDLQPSLQNVGGLVSWVIGDSDIGTFGNNIGQLGAGLHTFVSSIQGEDGKGKIDQGAVDLAISSINALNEINNALPSTGGLFQLITGGKSLASFGNELPDVGKGLNGLFAAFKMEDGTYDVPSKEDIERITGSLTAFQGINKALTDETGTGIEAGIEKLLGISSIENLGDFSSTLPDVGKNLSAFSLGFDKNLDPLAVSTAVNSLIAFSTAAKALPEETNSRLERFMGISSLKNIGTFSENFPMVAKGLVGFVTGFGDTKLDPSSIQSAADAISTFAGAAKGLPEETSSIMERFLGLSSLKNLGTFSDNFPTVAKNLIAFVEEFEGQTFDTGTVQNAADAISILSGVAEALPDNQNILDKIFSGDNSLKGFTSQLSGVGGDITAFSKAVKDINYGAAYGAITLITSIANLASTLAEDTDWSTGLFQISQFLWDMMGSENLTQTIGTFASQIVTSMASQIDTDVNKAQIQAALSNLFSIDTDQLGSAPTISPVLDLSNFDMTGQLGTLFDSSGLSAQLSAAITFDSIGLSPIADKLDSINAGVSNLNENNSSHLNSVIGVLQSIHSMEGVINSSIGNIRVTIDYGSIDAGLGNL